MKLALIGLFLIAVGVIVKHFKLYFLMAGYNTMSPEEKATYNVEALATLFRNVFCAMGVAIIISALLAYYNYIFTAKLIFWSAFGVGIIYLIVRGNSKPYKK